MILHHPVGTNASRRSVENREVDQSIPFFELFAAFVWRPGDGNLLDHIVGYCLSHLGQVEGPEMFPDSELLLFPPMEIENLFVGLHRCVESDLILRVTNRLLSVVTDGRNKQRGHVNILHRPPGPLRPNFQIWFNILSDVLAAVQRMTHQTIGHFTSRP